MWKHLIKNIPTHETDGYVFKMQNSFDKRFNESQKIKGKFPEKIPIIMEKGRTSQIPTMEKQKFVVPKDITAGQFLVIIRQKIKLTSAQALFLIINGKYAPLSTETMGTIYNKHADKDGFLYITYSAEDTFG
jgi:GABA(A) receptor-associated protein